eukprot:1756907-Amphidinium_carterae.1
MAYAFMYMPLLREEAMSQEITILHRCCACHRERDLVACANTDCHHRACPHHTSRCDEFHPFSPRDVVRTRPAARRVMDRWEREQAHR